MIPRVRPDLRWRELPSLVHGSTGDHEPLEAEWRARFGYGHAVWFPQARLAIQCYLECLEPKPHRVAVQSFTCGVVGSAIAAAGMRACLLDVSLTNHQPLPEHFQRALAEPDSAGIVIRAWGGSASAPQVRAPLLWDLAMASLDERPVTGLREEDAVVYSTGKGKPVSALMGGFLCGNSATAAERWRAFRARRLLSPSSVLRTGLEASIERVAFEPALFGVLARLAEYRAALPRRRSAVRQVGSVSDYGSWHTLSAPMAALALDRIRSIDAARAERAQQIELYRLGLEPLIAARFDALKPEPFLSHFPLLVPEDEREPLRRYLLQHGVYTTTKLYDTTLEEHPTLVREAHPPLQNSRRLLRGLLHLPLYRGLGAPAQRRVVNAIRQFYGR